MSSINIDQSTTNAYNVYMHTIQYTIRGISPSLDKALRARAKRENKSFNQTLVHVLEKGAGMAHERSDEDFFRNFIGMGKDLLDDRFYEAIADQSRIEPEMWK